jgi:hypothetical protein
MTVVRLPDGLQPFPQRLSDAIEPCLALDEPEKVTRDFDLIVAQRDALRHHVSVLSLPPREREPEGLLLAGQGVQKPREARVARTIG